MSKYKREHNIYYAVTEFLNILVSSTRLFNTKYIKITRIHYYMRFKARFPWLLSFMLCWHKPRYYSNYNPISKYFQRQHQYYFG